MTEPKKSIADGVQVNEHDQLLHGLENTAVIGQGVKFGKSIAEYEKEQGEPQDIGDLATMGVSLLDDGAKLVAGCAMDAVSFFMDPLSFLVNAGLDLLLTLFQPLQDALHFVTGDGPSLGTAADNFAQVGEGFVALADDWVATGDKGLAQWQEDAGEAARKAMADFGIGIRGIGSMSGSVADTLRMWSMVMVVIEETIKAIISELVSWAIMIWLPALAASVMSLGTSVAAAMSATIGKVASAFTKVTKHLGKLGQLLDKFMQFLVKLPLNAHMNRLAVTTGRMAGVSAGRVLKGFAGTIAKDAGKKGGVAVVTNAGKKAAGVLDDESDVGGDQSPESTRRNLDM